MYRRPLLLLSLCVCLAWSYPTGAPKCSAHVPSHESIKAQTSASPFRLTVSPVSKSNGKSTVTVTITGADGAKFKGFFVYASAMNSNDKLGMFVKSDKNQVLKCGDSSATTHVNNDKKNSVSFVWTAPDKFRGDVEFKATVVKEFKQFWTGMKAKASIA